MDLGIDVLAGKTFDEIVNIDDEEIQFRSNDGPSYRMYHSQDCCEHVYVEDVVGDLKDLVGVPIIIAEEVDSDNETAKDSYDESFTWTFYKLRTIKGSVLIRWYGSSNGYYSESVSIVNLG